MPILNLNNTDKIYYGATEVQKLYKGSELLYSPSQVDPYLNDVLLHLKCDEFPLIDSSPTPKTVSAPNSNIFNVANYKYGIGSLNEIISSNNISIPNQAGLTTLVGATIEMWINLGNTSSYERCLLRLNDSYSYSYMIVFKRFLHKLQIFNTDSTVTLSQSVWQHLAFVFHQSNSVKIYLNGELMQTLTITTPSLTVGSALVVGSHNSSSQLNAYLDSIRITNAIRYTTNFNPETDTYLAY